MPTTPTPRAIRADRRDDQSEAAWKSRRWASSRVSTAAATNDSSTSAPAIRWRTMVPDNRTTATRHARRWPRRMPRPSATRASPAMAISAPAASLARRGRNSSTTWSRPRRGGVMASSRSMTPATRMAAEAQRRTRRTRRWARRRSGAGGHDSPMGNEATRSGCRLRLPWSLATSRSSALGERSSLRARRRRTCSSAPVSSSTQLTRWLWRKTGGRPRRPRCSSTTSPVAPTLA